MSGLTWLHISNRLQKCEKKFDRQVIEAALTSVIRGRRTIGPRLSMMDLIIFNVNIAFSGDAEKYDAKKRNLLGPLFVFKKTSVRSRSEDRSTWTEKI